MPWADWVRGGYDWVRAQDLRVLLLALVVVSGCWVFVGLAVAVKAGETRTLDEEILRAIRPANRPVWVDETVRDVTALGGTTVLALVTAAVTGFLVLRRQHHAAILVAAALAGGLILNLALKDWFGRPRPAVIEPLAHVSSASFPSGHSLLATVVYLTLGALLARLVQERPVKVYLLSLVFALVFLIGLSRIYLGVHYPTDVLAGWTAGLVWAILCWLVARRLQQRGAVEPPK